MISRELNVINKLGLHARAAAKFVTTASQFACDIDLVSNSQKVNAKSIMGVMMLAAGQGSTLTLIADGQEEGEAVDALDALVRDCFGEGE